MQAFRKTVCPAHQTTNNCKPAIDLDLCQGQAAAAVTDTIIQSEQQQ